MAHCPCSDGTDRFDVITPLEQRVEEGKAPESIIAERYAADNVDRTRPLWHVSSGCRVSREAAAPMMPPILSAVSRRFALAASELGLDIGKALV
jgi:hypothetical protein